MLHKGGAASAAAAPFIARPHLADFGLISSLTIGVEELDDGSFPAPCSVLLQFFLAALDCAAVFAMGCAAGLGARVQWKFAAGLRALVAVHMHLVCDGTCLQIPSVVTDHSNSMLCGARSALRKCCVSHCRAQNRNVEGRTASGAMCACAARHESKPKPNPNTS